MLKKFPTLYCKSSKNKIKKWSIEVYTKNNKCFIKTSYGYTDSKITDTEKEVIGKNKGRSNETTPFEQGCLDAKAKVNKQLKKGYVYNIDDLKEQKLLLPMLAKTYKMGKTKINNMVFVQPKLNGARCIFDGDKFYSRNGLEIKTLDHIKDEAKDLFNKTDKCPLDGEIYNHNWNFQEIIRHFKKERDNTTKLLQFHIFDIIKHYTSFDLRKAIIAENWNKEYKTLSLVKSYYIEKNNVKIYHDKYIKEGYEGIIIRNPHGLYEINTRSSNLYKYKEFLDEEFTITGAHEGSGDDKGTAIFELVTDKGNTFSAKPRGNRELRRNYLKNINNLIGKKVTVRYQEKSEKGTPIFGVVIGIRDYE